MVAWSASVALAPPARQRAAQGKRAVPGGPRIGEKKAYVNPAGRGSVTPTAPAAAGPWVGGGEWLVRVMVKVTASPSLGGGWSTASARPRSGSGAATVCPAALLAAT